MKDKHNRRIDYLRLSITDRCNLRCRYCLPEEGVAPKPRTDIMSYEEILTFAKTAALAGITRVRVTGGEPLVRKGVVGFIRRLSTIEGLEEISLTTNGLLLRKYAKQLKAAGLSRINISIDSLIPDVYRRLTRRGKLEEALAGMRAALEAGMDPVKINVVALRGVNDDLEPFAELIRDYPVHVRFIEYMSAFHRKSGLDFVSGDELAERITSFGLQPGAEPPVGAGPARYFHISGAKGTFGLIGSSKGHFCADCNRLRLTADGKLRTCLFSDREIDILPALRTNASETLLELVERAIIEKPKDRFSGDPAIIERTMSQIGG